jgi:hypothetical protein
MIDKSILNVIESAKAYAALIGSLLTTLVAVNPDIFPPQVAVALAFLTAFATWRIPNGTPAGNADPEGDF